MRYLIAGHGNVPHGMRSAVQAAQHSKVTIDILPIKPSGDEYKRWFDNYVKFFSPEKILVLTDILLGSETQYFMYQIRQFQNIQLFTGVTASLALALIELGEKYGAISTFQAEMAVESARILMKQYVAEGRR